MDDAKALAADALEAPAADIEYQAGRFTVAGTDLGIGLFETFVSAALGDAWASAALYLAVLAVLVLRPQGLFGEPAGRRA